MRALAVAQAWQDKGGAVRVMFGQPNRVMESRLASEFVEVATLSCDRGSPEDADAVVGQIRNSSPAAVLVDGYDFQTDYLLRLQQGGRPVVLFDDYVQAARLPVQAVVNQNLYAKESQYATAAATSRLLVGPRYAALRREFRRARELPEHLRGPMRRIVVTLGGGDADNVTSKVLDALASLGLKGVEVVVLAGAQNPHVTEIKSKVQSLGGRARLEVDRRNMPDLLSACDLAVCGAGVTCLEMACMGVVTLPIILAQNQVRVAAAIDEHSIGRSLGWHHALDASQIAAAIEELTRHPDELVDMRNRARTLVDGLGAGRVADEIENLASIAFVPVERIP
jgi:UDP-2,4-diacetamido-2,4,6-trideoxy-beta-L-altropyranose hydrolase